MARPRRQAGDHARADRDRGPGAGCVRCVSGPSSRPRPAPRAARQWDARMGRRVARQSNHWPPPPARTAGGDLRPELSLGPCRHAVGWLSLAIALTVAIPTCTGRIAAVAAGALLAALVGLSRIYLRAHGVSDVLAGEVAVTMYALAAAGSSAWHARPVSPARNADATDSSAAGVRRPRIGDLRKPATSRRRPVEGEMSPVRATG